MIENQIAIYPEGFRGKPRHDSTDILNALAVQHLRWQGATAEPFREKLNSCAIEKRFEDFFRFENFTRQSTGRTSMFRVISIDCFHRIDNLA